MRRAPSPMTRQTGLTLIEMIVAIVIGGILVALTGMFVRGQIAAYFDVSNRTALADDADTAVRRIAREVGNALPNSVRVTCTPLPVASCTDFFLEFIPVRDAGRYRSEIGAAGPVVDRALKFGTEATTEFDVLGPAVTVAAGDQIVVYNSVQSDAAAGVNTDAYLGGNRRTPTATGSLSRISVDGAFPVASPANRFHVVSAPVSYVCHAGTLRRYWGYGFNAVQPTGFAAGSSALMSANVDPGANACSFTYALSGLQNNGLVSIRLVLTRNGESAGLQHQVAVNNSP